MALALLVLLLALLRMVALPTGLLAAASALAGMATMFFVVAQISSSKWPVIRRFIDTGGIRARLRELEMRHD